MTIAQLKKVMTDKELPGRSKLTVKAEIIDALNKFDAKKIDEPAVVPKEQSYSDMTVSQLKKVLADKNIIGRSKLFSKEKMIEAIVQHDANPNAVPSVEKKKKTKRFNDEDLKKLIEDAVSNIEKTFIQDASSDKWVEIKNTMLNIAITKKVKNAKKTTDDNETSQINKKVKKPKPLPETEVSKAFSTPGKKVNAADLEVVKVTKPPSINKYKRMNKTDLLAIIKERNLTVNEKAAKYDLIAAIASDDIVRNMEMKEEGVNLGVEVEF